MNGSANLDYTDLISQQSPGTMLVESKKKSGASLPAHFWMGPHTGERFCSLYFGSYTHRMLGVHSRVHCYLGAISVTGSVERDPSNTNWRSSAQTSSIHKNSQV